jgi:hypothetical protein
MSESFKGQKIIGSYQTANTSRLRTHARAPVCSNLAFRCTGAPLIRISFIHIVRAWAFMVSSLAPALWSCSSARTAIVFGAAATMAVVPPSFKLLSGWLCGCRRRHRGPTSGSAEGSVVCGAKCDLVARDKRDSGGFLRNVGQIRAHLYTCMCQVITPRPK